ncbi:translation initiation factor IF-2 [Streptomyces lincolnensis]|uniref:translation initiation factor IF-2 n=1 Tax=Streptomyces lincolnensis TaxID=1915 RepID=UPI001E554E0C|nr:translation initiation factor IF-2 [Streptomyces lincolnensis]MCD7440424.1 translation initiation factor IF-2 [Streptomyces lincolnensis]
MPTQGPGGSTSFENMSHEQMLAWLDQANAGTVQAAADRLIAAAKEIRKIADELKVRPQYVEWKGDGADAFRTWTGDLANSTLRLGDFSEDAAKWLGQASGAIAAAQASIPRDMPSATANLAAANSARNDPDAAAVSAKSRSELEALAANREKVRLEAAAQMRKLGQSYQVSSAQMGALERPKFPPPPAAFVPSGGDRRSGMEATARPGVSGQQASPSVNAPISHTRSGVPDPRQSSGVPSPERRPQVDVDQPTRMSIDSVDTLLPRAPGPHAVADPLPGPDQLKGGPTPQTGTAPPVFGTPVNGPAGQGRSPATGRMPFPPGQSATSNPSRMPAVGGGSGNGIVGGRPVPQSPGKSMGIPRGTVVGGEGTAPRGPMGQTAGSTNPGGRVMGQTGQTPGRRPSVSNGGVVGGRPLPNDGVANARPQQPGRTGATGARPGTPGAPGTAAGPGTAGRGVVGSTPGTGRHSEGHGTGGTGASHQNPARRTSGGNGRPYGVVEDEETWRQGTRPAVPPVIDRRTQE